MDYSIYGMLYPMVGWTTDFEAIDFAAEDLVCYELNGYDPVTSPDTIPTYS